MNTIRTVKGRMVIRNNMNISFYFHTDENSYEYCLLMVESKSNDRIIEFAVDNESFYNYLDPTSLEYIKRNLEDDQVVREYLKQIRNKMGLERL